MPSLTFVSQHQQDAEDENLDLGRPTNLYWAKKSIEVYMDPASGQFDEDMNALSSQWFATCLTILRLAAFLLRSAI